MTQELIANMLGVRREGVTAAAGKLQDAGLIRYHRGKITVLDRRTRGRCCECYRGGQSGVRSPARSRTSARDPSSSSVARGESTRPGRSVAGDTEPRRHARAARRRDGRARRARHRAHDPRSRGLSSHATRALALTGLGDHGQSKPSATNGYSGHRLNGSSIRVIPRRCSSTDWRRISTGGGATRRSISCTSSGATT